MKLQDMDADAIREAIEHRAALHGLAVALVNEINRTGWEACIVRELTLAILDELDKGLE